MPPATLHRRIFSVRQGSPLDSHEIVDLRVERSTRAEMI